MITGLVIILTTGMSSLDTITNSISNQVSSAELKLGETCSLGRLVEVDGHTVRMNITNTGDTPLTAKDFSKIDVLVLYRTASGASTSWVRYVQGGSGERWTVTGVYFNGGEEVMNPITLSPTTYGVWDPLETIEVDIRLNATVTELDSVMVTLPNGYRVAQSALLESNYGTAVVARGDFSTVVYHILSGVPKNVQLTPQGGVKGVYWVSNVTSTSFVINLGQAQGGDLSFYWFCQR